MMITDTYGSDQSHSQAIPSPAGCKLLETRLGSYVIFSNGPIPFCLSRFTCIPTCITYKATNLLLQLDILGK